MNLASPTELFPYIHIPQIINNSPYNFINIEGIFIKFSIAFIILEKKGHVKKSANK